MIVKDEEKFLEHCLDSVRHFVSEIILVDTGSRDRTREIGRSLGARIYEHSWENDFSKHRNQSIQYAHGDWILWLDADEALEPGGDQRLQAAVCLPGTDGLLVTMVCYFDNRSRVSWNNSLKLFKNKQGIHFEGTVHNQVKGVKAISFCPVKFFHYGYDQGPQVVQNKFMRTSALLRQAIQKEPGNFRHHHDLAVALASQYRFSQALDSGLKAIELYHKNHESDPNILWTYFVTASANYNLDRLSEARSLAEAALKINPCHLDSFYVLALVQARQKNRAGFEQAYKQFMEWRLHYESFPEHLGSIVINTIGEKWRLDLEYGALLLDEGLKSEAVRLFSESCTQAPDPSKAYQLAGQLCRMRHALDSAGEFFDQAGSAGLASAAVQYEKAQLKQAAGQESVFRTMLSDLLEKKELSMEPQTMVSLAADALKLGHYTKAESLLHEGISQGFENAAVCTLLALALKYQGKVQEAVDWNLKALEYIENDQDALVNLGHLYYEQKNWRTSCDYYQRALKTNPNQADVLLRLSLIALMDQDLETCIQYCDRLLNVLDVPHDLVIDSFRDVAQVYRWISEALVKQNKKTLAAEALILASGLDAANP
jgi:tetratricopeptide (TPR) repeat protein